MNVGQGYPPPQSTQPQTPNDLRGKVVEILAHTANGCLTELGYWPGMPQRLQELEKITAQYEQENLKLWQDNRILNQELERWKVEVRQLRSVEAEVVQHRNERQALLQQHPGDSHYRLLLADHQTLQAYYNAACAEIRQLRDYINKYAPRLPQMSPSHSSNASSPTAPAIHNSPMACGLPPQPVPSQPVAIQLPPHVSQAQSQAQQPTHQRRKSSTRRPIIPSPFAENPVSSRVGSRPSSRASESRGRPSSLSIPTHEPLPSPPFTNPTQQPPLYVVPSQSAHLVVQNQSSPTPLSPQTTGPSVGQAMPTTNNPNSQSATLDLPSSSNGGAPAVAAQQTMSVELNIHPSETDNPVQRRSAFAPFITGGRPDPTSSLRIPSQVSSNVSSRECSSSAEVPLSQETAKRQRTMSGLSTDEHQLKRPRTAESEEKSGSQPQASQVLTPQVGAAPQGQTKSTTPEQATPTGKLLEDLPMGDRSLPEAPEAQSGEMVPIQPSPEEVQAPQDSVAPGERDDENGLEIGDVEEVELDADGFYPVEECLAQIMEDEKDHPGLKYCALCIARFAQGHLSTEPTPFVNAVIEELVLHCTTEHPNVWNRLRQPD